MKSLILATAHCHLPPFQSHHNTHTTHVTHFHKHSHGSTKVIKHNTKSETRSLTLASETISQDDRHGTERLHKYPCSLAPQLLASNSVSQPLLLHVLALAHHAHSRRFLGLLPAPALIVRLPLRGQRLQHLTLVLRHGCHSPTHRSGNCPLAVHNCSANKRKRVCPLATPVVLHLAPPNPNPKP